MAPAKAKSHVGITLSIVCLLVRALHFAFAGGDFLNTLVVGLVLLSVHIVVSWLLLVFAMRVSVLHNIFPNNKTIKMAITPEILK